jgi:uncharacterized protein (DUF1330 family)
MAAYLIVHRHEINDTERLKKYAEGVGDTIASYGGTVVVRADGFEVLEGDWHPGRKGDDSHPELITVIQFPDISALKAWYDSDAYAPFKQIRREAAVCDVVAVEGKPATGT